jgi:hypothetical protein
MVRKNCDQYGRKENDGMTDVTGYGSVECMIMGNGKVEMKMMCRRNRRREGWKRHRVQYLCNRKDECIHSLE